MAKPQKSRVRLTRTGHSAAALESIILGKSDQVICVKDRRQTSVVADCFRRLLHTTRFGQRYICRSTSAFVSAT